MSSELGTEPCCGSGYPACGGNAVPPALPAGGGATQCPSVPSCGTRAVSVPTTWCEARARIAGSKPAPSYPLWLLLCALTPGPPAPRGGQDRAQLDEDHSEMWQLSISVQKASALICTGPGRVSRDSEDQMEILGWTSARASLLQGSRRNTQPRRTGICLLLQINSRCSPPTSAFPWPVSPGMLCQRPCRRNQATGNCDSQEKLFAVDRQPQTAVGMLRCWWHAREQGFNAELHRVGDRTRNPQGSRVLRLPWSPGSALGFWRNHLKGAPGASQLCNIPAFPVASELTAGED